jgi:hypothetical protein
MVSTFRWNLLLLRTRLVERLKYAVFSETALDKLKFTKVVMENSTRIDTNPRNI